MQPLLKPGDVPVAPQRLFNLSQHGNSAKLADVRPPMFSILQSKHSPDQQHIIAGWI
ncbi:MAG TPA: hypothetical protein VMF91_21815 [Bryobacteraceae bacterium]|nr:hypothetical protein [Bryobacteraceae bacterium]